ncbi:FH2 domain-containing protein 1-like isoform X2 [Varroa destructor]|uniref:FH2 domain-containing protein n=1 Tax=Varroa destructor TaxID=109461 RepID=A0A7M7J8S4_VARDE|nr:FH2 domain-containing protein 1-like isoform X2 [Varroa destructor]
MARYVRQDPSELTLHRKHPSRWQSFLRALNGALRPGSRVPQRIVTSTSSTSCDSTPTKTSLITAHSTSPISDTSKPILLRTASMPGVHGQRVLPKGKEIESRSSSTIQTTTSFINMSYGCRSTNPQQLSERTAPMTPVATSKATVPQFPPPLATLSSVPSSPPPPPPPMPIACGAFLPVQKTACSRSEVAFATLPKPSVKMKTVNWDKIPEKDVFAGNDNVWKEVFEDPAMLVGLEGVDWKQLEQLFALAPKKNIRKDLANTKSTLQISLLDGRRALHVSLGLHRLKMPSQEVIACLEDCDSARLGGERLQILNRILPKEEEIAKMKTFSGDVSSLPACDRFLLELLRLPKVSNLVEALLLKEDFKPLAKSFESSLSNFVQVCNAILNSTSLKSFFRRVLTIGNYINSGSYVGNAAGFRLKDLCKLVELRTCNRKSENEDQLSLLDFVVTTAVDKDPKALYFVEEMVGIEQACRLDLEYMKVTVSEFESSVAKLKILISEKMLPSLEEKLGQFSSEADEDIRKLHKYMDEIDKLSLKMARWFCENPKTFKVSECLNLFHKLCQDVTTAKQIKRKVREQLR